MPGYASSITYHANGMVNQVAHANGVTYTQALDPNAMRRPASYSTTGATTNWTSGAYAYDGAGNVTAIGFNSYLYDPVSRLTSATQYTGAASGTGSVATQSATYDIYGNITSLTTNGAGLSLATSTSSNRLSSASYDSAGSMTWWNGNTYAYEPLGMTRNITASGVETVHIYTADDERVWTYQPGAPSRWTIRDLDGKVLREFKNNAGTWSVERDYVHRDGALLAAITPTETVHYHPDHLGSPRLITGTGGAYRAYHLYHPYGAEATAFNQDTERLKFTAHERDLGNLGSAADDIDYMHARFYQPQVGRFLGVDPVGGMLRVPQSWNRYTYAAGNPLKYTDPLGLFTVGFSAQIAVDKPHFYDEITVVGSVSGGSSTGGADAMIPDQAALRSFLSGQHAGGRNFNSVNPRSLGMSVRSYANLVAASGGAGPCSGFTCSVLSEVARLAPLAEAIDNAAIEMAMVLIPGPLDDVGYPLLKGAQRFTPDQEALVALAKSAKRKGVDNSQAETLLQWAREFGLPARGPEAHAARGFGASPHIHVGPVNHIPVRGYKP